MILVNEIAGMPCGCSSAFCIYPWFRDRKPIAGSGYEEIGPRIIFELRWSRLRHNFWLYSLYKTGTDRGPKPCNHLI
jgi:hypothetical protein